MKPNRIPLVFKIIYTAFVAVLVPYYWKAYGPTNFLYFCDVALLLTCVAIWMENSLLISASAVGILIPQAVWVADFFGGIIGHQPIGMTAYMFNPGLSLFTRGLSFFHFWLPFVLVWLIWRIGYDSRALKVWTGLAWCLMLVGYFILPMPPAPSANPNLPVNVNYVFGLNDNSPQTWMPALAWLGMMLVALPLLVYFPTHAILKKFFQSKA
jgi:hypothetical protein